MQLPEGYEPAEALSLSDALKLAMAMHRAHGLDDAERLYARILELKPDHADALHFMGVLQHQRGHSERALALVRRSIALDASVPDWHNNLGNVLLESGQADAAADAYAQAAALAADRADFHNNLGVLRRWQQRPAEAEAAYRRAIALDANYADPRTNLGRLLQAAGRIEEALVCYCEAVVLTSGHVKGRRALGMAYQMLGRMDEAVAVYREWLADEPGHPEAQHHLAACSGHDVPDRAPDAYVEAVFDGFANSFDAKLAMLDYRAPGLVAEAVAGLFGAPARELVVLDAGCGTGLCGPLLAPYAKRLDGVDLSEQMLVKARARQVYDGLAKAELTAHIGGMAPQSVDLIVSADTLCYFGDLRAVALAAHRALRADGWLVFTVEALLPGGDGNGDREGDHDDASAPGFQLHPHGRYSHRASYLRSVLAGAGFEVGEIRPVHLRSEIAKPVHGWLVTCRPAAHPEPLQ
ncbi:MAG: tetratricopeptide repeat protein [Gammaproteobacteria bacterium]|nr:tetratricopeptide repeat protein [Gammaproteobacteria bacterium]MBU1443698.1 tetratricopeptide repeat protein [Gammaproteobacteria bacterium]MBU2288003.1 tetratricopeptide repeat protein [Gammaproteobacteria bacterium]